MKIKNTIIFILIFSSSISCDGQNNKNNTETAISKTVISKNNNQEKQLKCGSVTFYNPVQNTKNLWQNFKIGAKEFQSINSEEHTYYVETCSSITVSPDNRVFLFRELLRDAIQDNYNTYEAPYLAFDINTQRNANYIGIVDEKVMDLSLSNAKADFVNSHDFIFEENIYYLSNEFLKKMPSLIKNNKLNFNIDDLKEYLSNEPLNEKNLSEYNDIAYYLGENNRNKEGSFLLNIIVNQFPDRVVAWLNLADLQWKSNEKQNAKISYEKYIYLMKIQKKDLSKIPKRVYKRVK